MYGEYVTILVDYKKVSVFVPCVPNTPEKELKKRAIDIYTYELKAKLLRHNGLSE